MKLKNIGVNNMIKRKTQLVCEYHNLFDKLDKKLTRTQKKNLRKLLEMERELTLLEEQPF